MMLWPHYRETYVLPFAADQAQKLLIDKVKGGISNRPLEEIPFRGYIGENEFAITPVVRTTPAFTPYICGTIEATSKGCIILIEYRLRIEAKIFLLLWMVVGAGLALFLLIWYQAHLQALLAAAFGAVNYLIALNVFRLNLKRSRREINRIFGI